MLARVDAREFTLIALTHLALFCLLLCMMPAGARGLLRLMLLTQPDVTLERR